MLSAFQATAPVVDSGVDSGPADSGSDSGTDGGAAPIMSAFLTPNDGPSSGGTVIKNTLTGGGCGGGTPTVVFSAAGYSAPATSVTCVSGALQFTSPAFNVSTSSTTDITVTVTTTGGTVASLRTSTRFTSSIARTPSPRCTEEILCGGVWTMLTSNVGSKTLTSSGSPTTSTLNGITVMSILASSSQYANFGGGYVLGGCCKSDNGCDCMHPCIPDRYDEYDNRLVCDGITTYPRVWNWIRSRR